ncbi:MAG: DEAD/DEAH box helicase [Acidobacteriota bacterium]
MLKGLFIGIDRHSSTDINWLTCARRDATALHALFNDTLGGQNVLLVDELATQSAINRAFEELQSAAEDDLVVITFSGHGSETHEIVTYDADLMNLPGTCIPLDTLGTWLSKIPARNLVLVLDCCFSGGMGSRGLHVEAIPRDIPSADSRLQQLSGKGRLILTASASTEPAWESGKVGHGFLTHHLLEGLQGPPEIIDSGKLSIFRLLEFVTKRVIDSAAAIGKQQHPAVRGSVDGDLTWPLFAPGITYFNAFPNLRHPVALPDIQSLAAFGFPAQVISAWAGFIPSLNQLQLDAINDFGLLQGEHLVVSAPTSSGKTLIGELAAVNGALQRKRAFFLFPLKALANDKWRHFSQIYGPFGLRTIRVTGDSTSDEILALLRGQYDICLMTYEKCAAMLLGNPHLLEQIGTLVVDEMQMITDQSRGVNLEFLITLLRMRRRTGAEPQVIALSAVIGDTNGFERWLGARLLRRNERPVPLDEGILRANGSYRYLDSATNEEKVISNHVTPEYRKGTSQDVIIPLVRRLSSDGKSTIVFRETKSEARSCAKYLAEALSLPEAATALGMLPAGDVSVAANDLRETLRRGVGFHVADLSPDERQVVEEEFRKAKELRILAATTTLAMGINTPAEAVIVAGLEHPGNKPYSVAEYKNIIGRAGRLGLATKDTSYLIALTPNDEHYLWSHYVMGAPEAIQSQLLQADSDLRSLILRVLATAEFSKSGMRAGDIVTFLEESFAAFLNRQLNPSWSWDRTALNNALNDLLRHKLVAPDADGLYQLTELGRLAGVSGTEVESVIRIVDALLGLRSSDISDPTLITVTQLTVELDDVLFPMNKKSTQKEPQMWFGELRHQGIPHGVLSSLQRFVQEPQWPTLRAKKASACLMWMAGMPMAQIESTLTQFGGGFGGAAGPMRSVKSRTCDLLPTVARIAELLTTDLNLGDRVERLLTRLEIGVPSAAVDLAALAGDKISRGDYLRLINVGLATPSALQAASDESILACVDASKAKMEAVKLSVKGWVPKVIAAGQTGPILPVYEG